MIGFCCTNCGHAFSVQDEYLGQRIKCPGCDSVGIVVDDSGRIKVVCQNCGNENSVPETLAGREVQCPKCNNTVTVPSVEKEPAENADHNLQEKTETPGESEISERSLIIIICATAAVIVTGLIIIAAVRSGN